jgi:hypothetical protein
MKKFLLSLLVIILALGLLGAVGVAGYRTGFTQGMIAASVRSSNGNGTGNVQPRGPGFGIMRRGMPMDNFGFNRGFERDGFGMMHRGRGTGFGLFGLFGFLVWLLFLGLIVAGIVWLINRSGWRLTRTAQAATSPAATTTVVETPPAGGSTTTVVETPPSDAIDEENKAP